MTEKLASVIFESHFDSDTLEILNELRRFRLKLLEEQLADLPGILKTLADRNLYKADMGKQATDDLKKVLEQKVEILKKRISEPATMYTDEIDLYLDLMMQKKVDNY